MERLPQPWKNQESVQDAWALGRQEEKNETALEITVTLENLIVSCSPSLREPRTLGILTMEMWHKGGSLPFMNHLAFLFKIMSLKLSFKYEPASGSGTF